MAWDGLLYRKQREDREETEVEKLRRELAEANAIIEKLRRALGSNHPLGLPTAGIFG